MSRLVLIAAAGALGTLARYAVTAWAVGRFGPAFPFGTIIVNVVGCFVIALVMHTALAHAWPATLRLTLVVGLLGGFTTYSSFNYDTMRLVEDGAVTTAFANMAVTLAGGLIAGWFGLLVGRMLIPGVH